MLLPLLIDLEGSGQARFPYGVARPSDSLLARASVSDSPSASAELDDQLLAEARLGDKPKLEP